MTEYDCSVSDDPTERPLHEGTSVSDQVVGRVDSARSVESMKVADDEGSKERESYSSGKIVPTESEMGIDDDNGVVGAADVSIEKASMEVVGSVSEYSGEGSEGVAVGVRDGSVAVVATEHSADGPSKYVSPAVDNDTWGSKS